MLKNVRFTNITTLVLALLVPNRAVQAFLGAELAPLFQLVSGQLEEIRHLTEAAGAAKDQVEVLTKVNEGINRALTGLQSIEEIARRAKGLDPRAVRRLSDITNLIEELKTLRGNTEELLAIRTAIAGVAVQQGGLQAETAYTMGQEMIRTGATLSGEANGASPGRSAQISASASANSMISDGVQLQTLAQIAQMQAVELDLARSQIAHSQQSEKERSLLYAEVLRNGGALSGPKAHRNRSQTWQPSLRRPR